MEESKERGSGKVTVIQNPGRKGNQKFLLEEGCAVERSTVNQFMRQWG
jgi:hypothetical protein